MRINFSKCRFHCLRKFRIYKKNTLQEILQFSRLYMPKNVYGFCHAKHTCFEKKKSKVKEQMDIQKLLFAYAKFPIKSQWVCQKVFAQHLQKMCAKGISKTSSFSGYDKSKYSQLAILQLTKPKTHNTLTSKTYLSSDLNISIMYRIYSDSFGIEKGIQLVSKLNQQKIFHTIESCL